MHPIENVLNITMSELKEMVDVNTVVGKPFVTPNGQTIIPVSKVSFGFVSGGGEYGTPTRTHVPEARDDYPFAAGSSAGVSITPMAFVVSGKESLRLLSVTNYGLADKVIEHVPEVIGEITKLFKDEGENDCEEGNNTTDL